VRNDKVLYGHRRLTGQFGDDLVFAREDAVLIIDGNRAEMLDHELRQACLFETLLILRNGQRPVADLSAQHLGDGRGGGDANGAFLRAGLVDELNLILCPAVDGAKGAPSVFDSTDAEADRRAPVTAMTLESSQALEGGAMLLRYRIQNADTQAATGW
jgi:hypothetical protein